MGSGICTAGLQAGMNVILKEVNEKFLEVQCHSFFATREQARRFQVQGPKQADASLSK